jgi:hypothetical protein
MKKTWCPALLVVFLTIGICAAGVPDLLGKWTGSENHYVAADGSYKLSENMSVSLSIVEQKDRLFTGNVTYTLNGKEMVGVFAGAIGLDNKTLYIAEFNEGYDFGTIISDDEIELIYLADGETGQASIDKLHRIK